MDDRFMDSFYLIPNHLKPACENYAQKIAAYLREKGKKCVIDPSLPGGETNLPQPSGRGTAVSDRIGQDVEAVLVLGGDGTLLRACRNLVDRDLPLMGINMGTLGYHTEIELCNVYPALDRLIDGDFFTEERMMLSGSVYREKERIYEDIALNDIVIARHGRLRVIDFKIYVNRIFLCAYRADGIIISTATGSTGYSLSAGGPIVSPDARLMVMTPIAPHTMNSRPIVLPDDVEVTVEVAGRSMTEKDGEEVTFDGAASLRLRMGDTIRVNRSQRQTKLIRINKTSFVEILRRKMN